VTGDGEMVTGAVRHDAGRAFGFGVPIGALGGLIGLGGAEFRLPVLTGPASCAIPRVPRSL